MSLLALRLLRRLVPPRARAVASASLRERADELRKNYGKGFLVYWSAAWAATGLGLWGAVEWGGVDCLQGIARLDEALGTAAAPYVASHVNPRLGNAAVVVAVNETLEVVRLPLVVATTPAVVRMARRLLRR